MLSRLSPARRRFVLAAAALAVVLVAVLAGLTAGRDSGQAPDQSRPGPVLLVPGYGGSSAALAPMAASLRASGRDVTVVALPDQAQGSLDDQAAALASAADSTLARTGEASVDVVGYSAGGVVARIWVTEAGGWQQVRRLVTLGSPHHGTDVARLGTLVPGTCPVACQQLASGSAVIARLGREPLPQQLVAVSLWTTHDDVVVPPSSAVLEGTPSPPLQSICPADASRHGDLPRNPLTHRLVGEALGAAPLPVWGPGDCARLSS